MLRKIIGIVMVMGLITGCASGTGKGKTSVSVAKAELPSCYLKLLDKKKAASVNPRAYYCAKRTGEGIPENLEVLWLNPYDKSKKFRERGFAFLWHDSEALWLCAVMEDSDVYNTASGRHSDPHSKGDVVELFFQPSGDAYRELHLAPNLATTEFAWPSFDAFGKPVPGGGGLHTYDYDSGMQGQAGTFKLPSGVAGWWALMRIPFDKLGTSPDKLDSARFAVCRYNRNAAWGKKKPELSSIADFGKGSFHQPDKWFRFVTTYSK